MRNRICDAGAATMPKLPCSSLLQGLRRTLRACRSRWYKRQFLLDAGSSLRQFSVGHGTQLWVPTRGAGGRGSLQLGADVPLGFETAPRQGSGAILLQPRVQDAVIDIGPGTVFSNNVSVAATGGIRIRADCRLGDLVAVYDCDFHEVNPERRNEGVGPIEPVTIEDNVWLGSRVLVLRGVTIGQGSAIGAGSVVTCSIPARSLAVGIPARVLRTL